MRQYTVAFLAASFLCVLPRAQASTEQQTQQTNVDGRHFLLGTWDCKGVITVPAHKDHGEREFDTLGRLKVHKRGDKFIDSFQNRASHGKTFRHYGWTHYDEQSKSLHRRGVNNYGGWSRSVSPGWEGNKLVWSGELHAFGHQPIAVKETFTRGDNDGLEWMLQTADLDGRWDWKTMYKGTCNKPGVNDDSGDDDGDNDNDNDNDDGADDKSGGKDGGNKAAELWFLP